jgi:prepilin-type N-terminal cleavage/methylation domain-containing protein
MVWQEAKAKQNRTQDGFSLLEVMIAILVLLTGVVGLGAMLGTSLNYMNMSQVGYLAQQKAAEAVESIFTARDLGSATWSSICNVGSNVCCAGASPCNTGIFLTGANPLCQPGTDGIVDTADDFEAPGVCNTDDAMMLPSGATGTFGGVGVIPVRVSLSRWNFKRTITISTVLNASGDVIDNLRQIAVTVTYNSGKLPGSYTLTTDISNTL